MDQIWMKLNELAETNNGFFRTAQVEKNRNQQTNASQIY